MNDAAVIRAALDLGLQAWRTTPSRERFLDALAALERMEDEICTLLAEREFGPQTLECPDPTCSVKSTGPGYKVCPRCGGELVPA